MNTTPAPKIYVQDVSLRDGMHALRHRITPEKVGQIAQALDRAGVAAIEVSHGDGLAGASLNYGPGSHTDWEWIAAAVENVENAVITTLLLPGVGTIEDLRKAYDLGVRSVRVATHCTEADTSAQHIAKARELGMDVSGFLMMAHMIPASELAQQAKLMESYGAHCVYVTDSSGRLTTEDVRDRIRAYREVLTDGTQIGIHAHENLSLAVANSVAAVEGVPIGSTRPLQGTAPRPAIPPSRHSSPSRTSAAGRRDATCSRSKMPPMTSSAPCRIDQSGSTGKLSP